MMAYTRWGTQWSGANAGLIKGIMNEEWNCNGLQITDNVLTTYVNGVDGVMGGTTTFDAMLWYITKDLPTYENDPVVVAAMKEACHHNLYAIAHSCGMNGVGPDTTIKAITPSIIVKVTVAAVLFSVLFVVSLVLFIIKKRKFMKTEVYAGYKATKAEYKAAKKG